MTFNKWLFIAFSVSVGFSIFTTVYLVFSFQSKLTRYGSNLKRLREPLSPEDRAKVEDLTSEELNRQDTENLTKNRLRDPGGKYAEMADRTEIEDNENDAIKPIEQSQVEAKTEFNDVPIEGDLEVENQNNFNKIVLKMLGIVKDSKQRIAKLTESGRPEEEQTDSESNVNAWQYIRSRFRNFFS